MHILEKIMCLLIGFMDKLKRKKFANRSLGFEYAYIKIKRKIIIFKNWFLRSDIIKHFRKFF